MAARKPYYLMPAWGGPFELWSRNFVAKNYWRTAHILGSEEDALQQCALVFSRCLRGYKGKINSHAWFMGLFKSAVHNEWNTLSLKDTRNRDNNVGASDDDMSERFVADDMASDNWGALSATLRSTGHDLINAMQSIANAPVDALAILFGGPTDAQRRAKIRQRKGLDDDFSIECFKRFVDKRSDAKTAHEAAEALEALKALMPTDEPLDGIDVWDCILEAVLPL
jgi:hypothetical protein